MLSSDWLFMTPWTVAPQAPLSVGFSRQEYWRRLPFPSPEDLPNPGIEPLSLASPALAGRFFTATPPGKPHLITVTYTISENGPGPDRATPWITKVWENILTDLMGTPSGIRGKKIQFILQSHKTVSFILYSYRFLKYLLIWLHHILVVACSI